MPYNFCFALYFTDVGVYKVQDYVIEDYGEVIQMCCWFFIWTNIRKDTAI